jgi:DNA-binding transcriptional ArsR family regulator
LENNEASVEMLYKWASIFEVIANPTRLGILLVLYGSEFLSHSHSLTFTQIKEIMEIPSAQSLEYHLNKLIGAGLVEKEAYQNPGNPTGRVYPIFRVTTKWRDFIRETGLIKTFVKYIEETIGI